MLGSTGCFHREMGHPCLSSKSKRASSAPAPRAETRLTSACSLSCWWLPSSSHPAPNSDTWKCIDLCTPFSTPENKEARSERAGHRYTAFLGVTKQEGRIDQKTPDLNGGTGFYIQRIRDVGAGYHCITTVINPSVRRLKYLSHHAHSQISSHTVPLLVTLTVWNPDTSLLECGWKLTSKLSSL